jgi:hypothetical protein
MYTQVGSNGEKKRVKELIFSMILEWEFKETGKIVNVFMESGFSQMEKFIKETLKIISLMVMVNIFIKVNGFSKMEIH